MDFFTPKNNTLRRFHSSASYYSLYICIHSVREFNEFVHHVGPAIVISTLELNERNANEDFEDAIRNYKIFEFRVRSGRRHRDQADSPKKNLSPTSLRLMLPQKDHTATSLTQIKEDQQFTPSHNEPLLDFSDKELSNFQAHKDALTTLNFIFCPEKKLLTSSLDCYFKIWEADVGGKLISSNLKTTSILKIN